MVFELKKIADFGTGEPWFARTEMTMLDFLPFLRVDAIYDQEGPTNEEKFAAVEARKERLAGRIFAVGEELGYAFMDLRRLREAAGEFETQMETTKAYKELYGHLWSAYKDRFQKLMQDMGYDVSFIFQKDERYEELAAQYKARHPEVTEEFLDRIERDKTTWQKALRMYRDEGQHDQAGVPTFNGHPMHSIQTAEVMFYNTWHAMEDIFLMSMQEELGDQLTIFEIPNDRRRPEMPKKYQVGLRLDEQTQEVLSRSKASKEEGAPA